MSNLAALMMLRFLLSNIAVGGTRSLLPDRGRDTPWRALSNRFFRYPAGICSICAHQHIPSSEVIPG
jgi:hypothetical protein